MVLVPPGWAAALPGRPSPSPEITPSRSKPTSACGQGRTPRTTFPLRRPCSSSRCSSPLKGVGRA